MGPNPPVAYPIELEPEVRAGGSDRLSMRPILPVDAGRLVEFHGRLSPQSVYRRYFFMHPTLSADEIEHLTTVDSVDRFALIVESNGDIVAVGRYERLPDSSDAEVAFVVTDEFQHRGIGTTLLKHLVDAALQQGITGFVAQTMAENRDMLNVFLNSGYPVTSRTEYSTVSVRFPITPD